MMKAFSIKKSMMYNQNVLSTLLLMLVICNALMAANGQNSSVATPSPSPVSAARPANGTTNTRANENKALRIAIPVSTYKEFVSISKDPITKEQRIGGFSVEVFQAVVNTALSDPPEFKLIPFATSDGSFNGIFDAMLQAVFAKEYDGAVGDTTIRYDRTRWVDFTLPYSDTGITMMVSTTKQQQTHNNITRIKLIPLIKGLVSAALAFCFLSALVFWFVEFRNDTSRQEQPSLATNSPIQQSNNQDYWRRETIRAITHTRLVIVMWFLVLLFLSSCYAASLTSLLTAQRQKGPIKTLDEIIRKKAKIGNQKGSFMPRLLIQRGFTADQIVTYDTEEEMIEMLSKGSSPGGVVAVIDETPYLNVFLSKHCNKGYQLVPSFDLHAEGFGFAFPIGSPLVREISNGILKLMDGGELATIQDRTIGDQDACDEDSNSNSNSNVDSNLLDLDTMWILFAGAIGAAILVIILYTVYLGTTCDTVRRRLAYPCYILSNYRQRTQ